MTEGRFLPGVPEAYVLDRLSRAGGQEIASGKFDSTESSAALAANAFGWFVSRPELLPRVEQISAAGIPTRIELEYEARFPWHGGTHPWLDAAIFSKTHLIGVESKRFEPFRDPKRVGFSEAYNQPVWGDAMTRYTRLRQELGSAVNYRHLDAAQLVKHAYGLVTEGRRQGRRPILFYIYAEPSRRGDIVISETDLHCHRDEIADFARRVAGDEVAFASISYRDWLAHAEGEAQPHAAAVLTRFCP